MTTTTRRPPQQAALQQQPKPGQLLSFKEKNQSVRHLLDSYKGAIQEALPKHMNVERVIRVALTACTSNPQLLDCTKVSLIRSILQASQLGLECDGMLGHAYLIPFKKGDVLEAQLIPGYKGLMKLARNSGEIANIEAQCVRVGDEFSYEYGSNGYLKHRPMECPLIEVEYDGRKFMAPDENWRPGVITHAYCVIKLKDGSVVFDVLPLYKILDIRDGSQGYQAAVKYKKDNPWIAHFEEMARKTAVRRACKYAPSSVELQRALALEEAADAGVGQKYDLDIELPQELVAGSNGDTRLDALAAAVNQAASSSELPAVTPGPAPEREAGMEG